MSNSLDPDQDRHSVGPDLNPNCLQRLSADEKELGLCIRFTRTFRSALSVFPISLQMIVGCANTIMFDLILYFPVINFSVMLGQVLLV